jgi:hypothetical protein
VETIALIRDLAIILLALLNIVLMVILVVIAFLIWRLVRMVSREAPEFIDKAKQMTTTAQGTVDFVGSSIARPAITVTAFFAGFQRFLQVVALGNRRAAASSPPTATPASVVRETRQ